MNISICIPTYNRSAELALTLRTLSKMRWPAKGQHEILVIDNNSTDTTATVVEEISPHFDGRLRYVVETKQGLCHGRNRAISESKGDIIAFLDDDVDVDADWLVSLIAAYGSGNWAAVGGRAYLIFPGPCPKWLTDRDQSYLSRVELGDQPRLGKPNEMFGLNLSFRRDWIERVGMFNPELDRIGNCLLSGGETDLLRRISMAGGQLLYTPTSVVGHRVPAERLDPKWFDLRNYWAVRSAIRAQNPSRRQSLAECFRLAPTMLKLGVGFAYRRLLDGSDSIETGRRRRWWNESTAAWVEHVRCFCVGRSRQLTV